MTKRRPLNLRAAVASVILLLAACNNVHSAEATAAATVADPHLESVKEIYAWVDAAEGGFVTPKQSVRRMIEHDLDTPLIVYATEDIAKGELLVQTPWSHILQSVDEGKDEASDWYCGTSMKLAKEMRLGRDSFYAPYAVYINEEPDGQLPAQYSKAAKEMLHQIIGRHPDEINRSQIFERGESYDQRIMPERITEGLETSWYGACRMPRSDVISAKAASMVIQRADDDILIPAYDAYNHRNNDKHNGVEYMNAHAKTTRNKHHQTFALRDISKGEQIFISYNQCPQCGGRADYGFGTAEMYREYGFVEWFPQRWWYPGLGDFDPEENSLELNQFDLYKNEDSGDMTIVWTHLTKNEEKLDKFKLFLGREIRRLKRLKNIEWADMYSWTDEQWKESGISSYEWMNINLFTDANIVAMTLALADLEQDAEDKDDESLPLTVSQEELGVLVGDGNHYDPLEEAEIDDLAYFKYTCDNKDFFEFMGYIDTEEAFFTDRQQLMGFFESFFYNAEDDVNVCFDVNNNVQMCSSYRPYLHEYMTHAAARYVEKVERVAFVGNGDSMLLHEIMKYPDLELVVGLELDQTVTRKSFKHFKTDPYFDDPRVDWWFGDVAKSVLVLPESYWGSFDLVLIDLSEHVLNEDVTKDLDVFSVLSKLMKPDTGVMVKNELFLTRFAEEFQYSMELFYESPAVCSETIIIGSNNVDLYRAPIYDHGIEGMKNILYTKSPVGTDRHDMMHDFLTKDQAGKRNYPEDADEEVQTTASGVLEIVTLENLSNSLESFKSIAELTKKSIEEIGGFNILEDGVHYEDGFALIVMEEGYVAARVHQDERAASSFYVGFDISLWSQSHRIGTLKDTLQKANESKHVSSHKIVVGGMFGTKSWREDSKHVGLKAAASVKSRTGEDNSTEAGSKFDADSAAGIAVAEAVELTKAQKVIAAVFCGSESDSCTSLDVLKAHERVEFVTPIYDCSSDDVKEAHACEREIIEELKTTKGKLDVIVLDSDASQAMHQIVNSIFDSYEHREDFLRSHSIGITWSDADVATKSEPWRWEFLDRLRKQIHHDPVKLGEFVFTSGEKLYQFGVLSTKAINAVKRFDSFEKKVQGRLSGDASFQLRNVHGGLYNYSVNHKPKEFSEKDYDKTLANEHFEGQVPMARQTIMQYEGSEEMKQLIISQGPSMDSNFAEKLIYGSAITPGSDGLSNDPDKQTIFRYTVGAGCVILMVGENFNAIAVWDGQAHIDVNFFDFSPSITDAPLAAGFDQRLRAFSPFLNVATDVQPRGLGRVVNFPEDLMSVDRKDIARSRFMGNEEDDEDDDEDDDDDEDFSSEL